MEMDDSWRKDMMKKNAAWPIVFGALVAPCLLLFISAVTASAPKVERMVDVCGRKLHCRIFGDGAPAVVLVSGLNSPQTSWEPVLPELAALTTVLTYDRAGIGRSELGALPAHGVQSARDLHALLAALGVARPVVLVGHSLGGWIVRLYASLYPRDVAGLVLEETQHEDNLLELRKLLKGKDLEAFERLAAGMLQVPETPRTEADYREASRRQLRESGPLPRVPLVVLTCPDRAKAMGPSFSALALAAMAKKDLELMNRLAASVPGSRHILVEGTGHYIHMDKPQALVAPVARMIREAREKLQKR